MKVFSVNNYSFKIHLVFYLWSGRNERINYL